MSRNIVIGAVNWDAALPPETYFGHHCTRVLSPAKQRSRTPYFAEIVSENEIRFAPRTDEDYTRELQYAIDAGIDYFAHVWYGEEPLRELGYTFDNPKIVSGEVHELSYIRKLHARNPLRDKVKLCAILSMHPFTDAELVRFAETTKESYYQKVDGNRPLVYLYSGYDLNLIHRLRETCRQVGATEPYFVMITRPPYPAPTDTHPEVQGISCYAHTNGHPIPTYPQFIDFVNEKNTFLMNLPGLSLIPNFTIDWNPRPRIEIRNPWTNYPDIDYTPLPTPDELYDGMVRFADWVKQNPKATPTGHILVYSWNEFEEGGFVCPTYGENGQPATEILHAFARGARYWKENL